MGAYLGVSRCFTVDLIGIHPFVWDTVHPGRLWASREGNRPNEHTAEQILARIERHFAAHPPE